MYPGRDFTAMLSTLVCVNTPTKIKTPGAVMLAVYG